MRLCLDFDLTYTSSTRGGQDFRLATHQSGGHLPKDTEALLLEKGVNAVAPGPHVLSTVGM